MRLTVAVVCLLVAAVAADKCKEKCKSCKKVERSECLAGMEKDPECKCCDICSRFEGQTCDKVDAPFKFGQCGDGLECRDVEGSKPICQCIYDDVVCGSNNVTYLNLCRLVAAAVRENKEKTLKVESIGPCDQGAHIVTAPEYVRQSTNNSVVLNCEATGLPAPEIKWEVTKANKKTYQMPGDDDQIAISIRGGPGKHQVTGWLQIKGLLKHHEGDYTCVAINEHKTTRATARIKVIN